MYLIVPMMMLFRRLSSRFYFALLFSFSACYLNRFRCCWRAFFCCYSREEVNESASFHVVCSRLISSLCELDLFSFSKSHHHLQVERRDDSISWAIRWNVDALKAINFSLVILIDPLVSLESFHIRCLRCNTLLWWVWWKIGFSVAAGGVWKTKRLQGKWIIQRETVTEISWLWELEEVLTHNSRYEATISQQISHLNSLTRHCSINFKTNF